MYNFKLKKPSFEMIEKREKEFVKLEEIPFYKVNVKDDFWNHWIKINSHIAVFNQLEQLKKDKHIYNFKVNAGLEQGIHQGEFYYDSDLYKWLEGACYILKINKNKNSSKFIKLEKEVKKIAWLIENSQLSDGYLNTFYTTKFLNRRFSNLLIFHELYCTGHLIEASIAYKYAFNDEKLLKVAKKSAELLIKKFLNKKDAPGHPEIELALLKLANQTKNSEYCKLAKHLINIRGRIPHFKTYVVQRIIDMQKTLKKSKELSSQDKNWSEDGEVSEFFANLSIIDNLILLMQNFNGKMYQLNKPIKEAYQPVGHAVRAMYFYSGVADLYMVTGEKELLKALELIWLKMVKARMYITGGIGSQKAIEGFEGDFQHEPENSYSETCAAIGNIMWNWRLLRITTKAKYADLIEKLLYNAMIVGQSINGEKYFYYNPLISYGEHERHNWFKCPCCPTNVIRTIPTIGKYIYSTSNEGIWIHQYIGNEIQIKVKDNSLVTVSIKSDFPWKGEVEILINSKKPLQFSLFLRVPKWSFHSEIEVNSKNVGKKIKNGKYFKILRTWHDNERIKIKFEMKPKFLQNDPRIKATRNKIALSFGPLIYCLEQRDNKEIDIFKAKISTKSKLTIEYRENFLNGINIISGRTMRNKDFVAIPYYALGNRGADKMIVWLNREG